MNYQKIATVQKICTNEMEKLLTNASTLFHAANLESEEFRALLNWFISIETQATLDVLQLYNVHEAILGFISIE